MVVISTVVAVVASVATAIGGAVLSAVGLSAVGALGGGLGAVVVGGAIAGAVIGGVTSAVKGENIFDGILKGGLIGAAVGGAFGIAAQALAVGPWEGTAGGFGAIGSEPTAAMQAAAKADAGLLTGGKTALEGTGEHLISSNVTPEVSAIGMPQEPATQGLLSVETGKVATAPTAADAAGTMGKLSAWAKDNPLLASSMLTAGGEALGTYAELSAAEQQAAQDMGISEIEYAKLKRMRGIVTKFGGLDSVTQFSDANFEYDFSGFGKYLDNTMDVRQGPTNLQPWRSTPVQNTQTQTTAPTNTPTPATPQPSMTGQAALNKLNTNK